MNEHPVSGRVEVNVGLSARSSVQHTGGWTRESRWLLVTKYLARLQEIYGGAQIESNTDLWAATKSLMIDGYHLGEAFTHQLSLRVQVASTVANSPELQLCRSSAMSIAIAAPALLTTKAASGYSIWTVSCSP